jgi:hypothetical protein
MVGVHWSPELTFYERKIELLRYLEARGLLTAFRVSEGEISARLDSALVRVTPEHCDVLIVGPGADLTDARQALEYVVGVVGPSDVHMFFGEFQFVEPLTLDYDLARQVALEALMPRPAIARTVRFTDFSLLVDGNDSGSPSEFQAELGVIERDEAMNRLQRTVSRMGPPDEHRSRHLATVFRKEDFPSVAFFSDWRVNAPADSAENVVEWWDSAVEMCSGTLQTLMDASFRDDEHAKQTGAG